MESNEEFLKSLDERLVSKSTDRFGGRHVTINRNQRLSYGELARISDLLHDDEYIIIPTNINFSFNPAFSICRIYAVVPDLVEGKRLLTFADEQLPDGIRWEHMKHVYMSDRNLELLEFAGFSRPKELRTDYKG